MYYCALSSMPATSHLHVLICGSARSQLDFDGFYSAVRSLEREIFVHRAGVLDSEIEVGCEREVRRANTDGLCVFVGGVLEGTPFGSATLRHQAHHICIFISRVGVRSDN